MRLEVHGNKAFVTSASAELTPAGLLLSVSVRERWGPAHARGGSLRFVPTPGQERLDYDTLVFMDPTIEDEDLQMQEEAEVVIVAETAEDDALLRHTVRYVCQEKDTFSVLYLSYDNLKVSTELASMPRVALAGSLPPEAGTSGLAN